MIREATKEDMESIVDLWQELMDFHIERSDLYQIKSNARELYSDYLKDVMINPDYITLVFENEKGILGYLIATESNDPPVYEGTVGIVMELSVTQKHRNKGIGEKLLTHIEKKFLEKGIDRIECMVSDFNEISKRFWHKNGYEPYNLMCVKLLHK